MESGDIQDVPVACWGRAGQGSGLIVRFLVNGGDHKRERGNVKGRVGLKGIRRGVC